MGRERPGHGSGTGTNRAPALLATAVPCDADAVLRRGAIAAWCALSLPGADAVQGDDHQEQVIVEVGGITGGVAARAQVGRRSGVGDLGVRLAVSADVVVGV